MSDQGLHVVFLGKVVFSPSSSINLMGTTELLDNLTAALGASTNVKVCV